MAGNQPQLKDSYYGPAIPTARGKSTHNDGKSGCCSLFSFLWKLLVPIIVLFGLIILIFYLIVQPRTFKFFVTKAQLTQFHYTNNTLHYNMVLNFTAHNPNRKLSIYYDKVEAQAFYEGSRFSNVDVITHINSFRQYKKGSDPMSGVFAGQKLLMLDNDQVSEFNKDKNIGVYNIYVKLYFTIRFRLGESISRKYKPKVKCDITVPLSNDNGTRSTSIVCSTNTSEKRRVPVISVGVRNRNRYRHL